MSNTGCRASVSAPRQGGCTSTPPALASSSTGPATPVLARDRSGSPPARIRKSRFRAACLCNLRDPGDNAAMPLGRRRVGILALLTVLAVGFGPGSGSVDYAQTAKLSCAARPCPPPRVATFHYQLQGNLRLFPARIYDVDGENTPASFVEFAHQNDRYTVCYVNAGAWEDWRADRDRFPESVLGEGNGWPGERSLDIRQLDVLVPIMRDRFQQCRDKGFDAVDPDNINTYRTQTGFDLTPADQLTYNRRL